MVEVALDQSAMDFAVAMGSAQFRDDPYPLWHALRSTEPVHRAPTGIWLLTRYADIAAALRDRRFSSEQSAFGTRRRVFEQPGGPSLDELFGRSMLHVDPPEHTRMRGLVRKAFTPRRLGGLRPLVRDIADALVTSVELDGGMDLMLDFAYPLPVTVIFELMGVPVSDRVPLARAIRVHREARLRLVVEQMGHPPGEAGPEASAGSEPAEAGSVADVAAVLEQTAWELHDYVRSLLRRRRDDPGDDVLSRLATGAGAAEAGLAPADEEEQLGIALLLLVAGHETTINLIGNGVLALLRNPAQWQRLQRAPELLPNAIEELLRFDSPFPLIARVLVEDVTIGDIRIPGGSEVLAVAAAANRDPDRYPDPDRLNVQRTDIRHLSFGEGIHYCLGAPLARLEADIAFRVLLERLPQLGLGPQRPRWRPNPFQRGMESLQVTF